MKNETSQKKLILTALLVGLLQVIYNLFVITKFDLRILLTSFFEGTALFLIFFAIWNYIYKGKNIFSLWNTLFFSLSSSILYGVLLILLYSGESTVLFLVLIKAISLFISIKLVDYLK